jgi:6-phosphogluconolactonase
MVTRGHSVFSPAAPGDLAVPAFPASLVACLQQRGHLPALLLTLLLLQCCTGSLLAADAVPADGMLVWFGTSTSGKSESEGIYVARFDPTTGGISEPVLAAQAANPSFLAAHPTRPLIFAVAEVDDHDGGRTGGVTGFAIDEATGRLTALGGQPSGGGGPCHVSVDPAGRVVLAANYGGGSVICLGIDATGSPQPVVPGSPGGFVQHGYDRAGVAGIDARRQEKPHAHSIDVSFDGRFAFCCDLGLDEVIIYRLDAERATLAPHGKATLAPGSGPRHFALHPGGKFAWCVNELALTVTGFAFDAEAGTLTEIETLSTLPDDVTDRKGFTAAEIAVHPTGKCLYASNRGHDSIACYRIDDLTGQLSFLGTEPIRGQAPRHFALAPNGKFLLAAGQNSDTVTVFAIDEATGRLSFTGHSVAVPTPMCILFHP